MLLKIFLYILLPLFTLIYFFFKRKFTFFESRGVPHVKPSFPLGNLSGIGKEKHFIHAILDVYDACQGKDVICGIYNTIQPAYIILDPEIAKDVMIKDFHNFTNRGFFSNEENEPLSGSIFNLEDDRWRFIRNKMSPAFTSGKLKAMYPEIVNKGDKLIKAIDERMKKFSSIEFKDVTNRFTVDIISSVAFGMESNTLNHENERLITIFEELFGGENSRAQLMFFFATAFPRLFKLTKIKLFSQAVSDFFMGVVGSNIKHREESNDNRSDFLNMLIQLKNKGSIDGEFSSETKKLTLNEIMAQAFIFFFAGSDTSSTTISFALIELAQNQDMQERLRAEIEEKTKSTKGEITYEALMEMHYLNQVVNETLRMYTPGFTQFRIAANDYKVPNSRHIIPKGTQVWIPAIGYHYDKNFFPNPKKFDPERFAEGENTIKSSFTFLPFGEGPRNCIGMRFGLVNVKLGIVNVIKNFKLTPDSRVAYPLQIDPKKPQMQPIGGFLVKCEKIVHS